MLAVIKTKYKYNLKYYKNCYKTKLKRSNENIIITLK